ncbi:hypothetical protein [uncultured Algibacter sp.]|uniref:hypothetical protein n=1 Tax=uncultured Algibacter sp. TaxID=298659 RepID=UPI00260C57FF|nr:hypothetical protein [uncultured Algibacter sp.]
METTLKKSEKLQLKQKINLVDGSFTLSEARTILNGLLDTKINFHKIQRLSRTEGNINDSCTFDNSRIIELITSKEDTKAFLADARLKGKELKIQSSVTIQILD